MKWKNRRKSSNVNRGSSAPVVFGGGIGGLVLMLIFYFLGADPSVINDRNIDQKQNSQYEEKISEGQKELEDFYQLYLLIPKICGMKNLTNIIKLILNQK